MKNIKYATAWMLGIASLAMPVYAAPDVSTENDFKTFLEEKKEKDVKAEDQKTDPAAEKDKPKEEEKKKDKTLEDTVKDMDRSEGLFTFYRDPKSGELFMEIGVDQLDQEFIYFTYVHNGVTGVPGLAFRGAIGNNKVFSLKKHFNRIEFIEENTSFYYDPESPLGQTADANVSSALLATEAIKATSEDEKSYLIPVDKLFLSEALIKLIPEKNPKDKNAGKYGPGKLNGGKSKVTNINNYPENSDVIVDYIFDGPKPFPDRSMSGGIPRSGTLSVQHSFIKMPESGFTPRLDDPRIGYFFQRVTDMTSHSATPYRDMISRWNLVKKDPAAKISEPVKPITYWIENTTPHEYRDTIRDALLTWNIAFEKAGFKNAIEVKTQPDDATWDAGDIRYNVLRWTASPRPPFGGYGPNFVNPRTGEVLGADIMLEQVFVTNRLLYSDIFETAGLGIDGTESDASHDLLANGLSCSLGHQLQLSSLFGRTVLGATRPDLDKNELIKQSLYYLTLHEVGHTLGLNHNMKASQLHAFADIHDQTKTGAVGLTGSVMDYPAVNIAAKGQAQGDFYTMRPGPYDLWAIEFGYSPDMDDAAKRAALLARSGEAALTFGNDADDMRSNGKAIDPRVMIGDMSSDAIAFAENEMALAEDTMTSLLDKYKDSGQSWHEMRDAFMVLSGTKGRSGGVISRYIGGVYVDRSFAGQNNASQAPFTPVALADQKRAMAVLRDQIFAPDAFGYSSELISHLQQQRRGFDFFAMTEDPKMHQRVARIQTNILSHLIHKNTLQRLTDSRLYGNGYAVADMMSDLTEAIFKDDLKGNVNSYRQNLQRAYVQKLIGTVKHNQIPHQAHAAAFANLRQIQGWMKKSRKGNTETRAHRDYLNYTIDQALFPGKG